MTPLERTLRNILWIIAVMYAASIAITYQEQRKLADNYKCDKPAYYSPRGPVAGRCDPPPRDWPKP